jgi:hypothetical protein
VQYTKLVPAYNNPKTENKANDNCEGPSTHPKVSTGTLIFSAERTVYLFYDNYTLIG